MTGTTLRCVTASTRIFKQPSKKSWKTFHSDSGIIDHEDNEYIIVALVEHEKGGEVLVDLITAVEKLMDKRNGQ